MRLIRILGSIQWITDQAPDLVLDLDPPPDPAFFVSGFQDANKKSAFYKVFFTYYLGTVGTFTTTFKDKKSLRSHKTLKIKVLLNFLLVNGISVQINTDPDPDP